MDYYTILQVDPHADPEVIRAAYRRLAAKYHPDVDPSSGATERMKLLNIAYEVLSDPVKRMEHDMSRLEGRQQTVEGTLAKYRPWWILAPALIILFLLLRFSARLFLIAAVAFLLFWLLRKGQRLRQ